MNLEQAAELFHQVYQGPPFSVWITGGGFGFLEVLRRPGCSRFVHELVAPYSVEAINRDLTRIGAPTLGALHSCSAEAVRHYVTYLYANCLRVEPEPSCLAVSAALTTNRHRRGQNHAYFALHRENVVQVWHLLFSHPQKTVFEQENLPWRIRRREDYAVSLAIMRLLSGNPEAFDLELNLAEQRVLTQDYATVEVFEEV